MAPERAHAEAMSALLRAAAFAMTRATEDPLARARVRDAGVWLEPALRAYGLESNARWFRVVTAHGEDEPGRAPYAWGALAAPRLEALAAAIESAGTLEPLVAAEAGAEAHAVAIEECEEPIDPTQWLYCERRGERLALEWDQVLEYGLEPGEERTRIVLADGAERVTRIADGLHGKGTGRRSGDDSVEDHDGQVYRVLRAADARGLQPPPVPADIQVEEAPSAETPAIPAPEPPAGPPVLRALVADDSIVARVFLGRLLRQRGIEVDEAEDAASARALWAENAYDRVFLDADMPGGGAFTIADGTRPEVVVLVKDELERRHAASHRFELVLLKPFAEDEVARAVDSRVGRAGPGG